MPRHNLDRIRAALGLSESMLERERLRGEREAQGAQALASLVPLIGDVAGRTLSTGVAIADKKTDDLAKQGAVRAAQSGARSAGDVQAALEGDKDLAPMKKTGNPLIDFFANPLGANDSIRESARAKALGPATEQVQQQNAARAKAEADAAKAAEEQRRYEEGRATHAQERGEDLEFRGKEFGLKEKLANRPKPVDPMKAIRDQNVMLQNQKLSQELGVNAPGMKVADDLRGEFSKQTPVKQFGEVSVAYDNMKRAVANPSPASDLTLVYSFMKMNDPESIVKESEFATAAKAGTFGDRIQGLVSQVTSGQLLTPDQRADLLTQAEGFYATRKAAYDAAAGRYRDLAGRRGVQVEDVVPEDPQARFLRRVQELKAQGLTKEQAREQLRKENLLR